MVTVLSVQNSKQAENRMFLQIKSGRILDISLAFLIKQSFNLSFFLTVGHSQLGATRVDS